ncbi:MULTISPECIES: lysylphosphatidylglycerol synthase domain-containing protein [unclassified Erwinia]|uniref:lysylphosphatidylglycerol synthase domain-containing protein n=1 Tax=unclassified Erwinia TaxID=2622719 RepID=UPI0008318434|nr:lysylphosphatidylglycerol synthase domain-containing protein [Erwinia sp. ErVv1]
MSDSHPRWRWIKKILTGLFFVAVVVLLVIYARKVNWHDVAEVITHYNRLAILSSVALVIVSYLTYGVYDLIGQAYCGHRLQKRQVMLVSFICYAFNLTLSTWVGGVAMRYRLYSRLGLDGSTITRIFSLSIATNWLGYVLVAGVVFSMGLVPVPSGWFIGEGTLRATGVCLLAFVLVYLAFCAFSRRRRWTVKGHTLALPSLRMALLQFSVSSANWLVMGAIIWLLLGQRVDYPQVLGVLLISSIAGVIIHIPAGIGVLEAVFLALLSGEHLTHGAIIAALLAYRVIYFIAPLLLALVLYLWLESRAKGLRQKNQQAMQKT